MSTNTHILQPGQIHLSENKEEIISVLNNSTIVCIYDTKLSLIGMCHYLYPNESKLGAGIKKINSSPFNYGDFSIPTLLGLFKKKGSDRNNLEVSILGSSTVSSQDLANKIASENILCAEEWISRFGLRLKQKKIGLPEGMQVRFIPMGGGVFLKHLEKSIVNESDKFNTNKTLLDLRSKSSANSKSNLNSDPTPTSATNFKFNLNSIKTATESLLKKREALKNSNTNISSTISTFKSNNNTDLGKPSYNSDFAKSLNQNEKIKVLIVDDSKTIRSLLTSVLETSSNMVVMGQAADAFEAEALRIRLKPDVITLDIHMPDKDGVVYLEEILSKEPTPVVMVSDLSLKEASPVMKALEIGAFDYFQKPAANEISVQGPELINMIKLAYENRTKIKARLLERRKLTQSATNKKLLPPSLIKADPSIKLIAIGASTGGPDAIRTILGEFPEKSPPIIIVQHMPAKFTKTFAESLNLTSRIKVKEAENGDTLDESTAYIAPGGFQMAIEEKHGKLYISINDDPPMNRFKPSVDYTFNTLEKIDFKGNLRAAILTGMGSDGAYSMLGLKRKGNFTVAQDEATCVVYGMPRAAVEFKAVETSLPLNLIADSLLSPKKKASTHSA